MTKNSIFYVNASNLHVGGGAVLLNDFIEATKSFPENKFIIYVDKRFKIPNIFKNNIIFLKIPKTRRWRVPLLIQNKISSNDIVIYLTNLPPLIRHKCKTILVQSNRFVIENSPLSGFKIKTKIRIHVERIFFWLNKKNVDFIIVQSESMSSILQNKGIDFEKIKIIPYKNKEVQKTEPNSNYNQDRKCFLYIASDDPHKNHKNLIKAWCLLSSEKIYPKLIITIDENTELYKFITKKIERYKLEIEIKPRLDRTTIINLYNKSTTLIYPSFIESYGLPLVEASHYGVPVLASELDYVRDIIDPEETFDPNSAKSISRAVKRYLKIKDKKTVVVTSTDFIRTLISL